MNNMNEVRIAQTSRLGYRGMKRSFSSLAQLITSIFIKSLKTAQDVQRAIDSRGNNGDFHEVEVQQSYNKRNWLGIGCFVIIVSIVTFVF